MRPGPAEVYSLNRMPSLSKQRQQRRHRSIGRAIVVCAVVMALPALGAPKRPRKDTAPPVVEHTPITSHDGIGPVLLQARIVDDSAIFEPTLLVRMVSGADGVGSGGGSAFLRVPLIKGADDVFAAEVPAALLAGDLEYLIEAFDENGNGPSRVGDEGAPMVIKRAVPATTTSSGETPAAAGAGIGTGTGASGQGEQADETDGGGGLVVAGVVVGGVVLIGAAAGIAFAIYTLRAPAPEAVRIIVTAPAPIAGAL